MQRLLFTKLFGGRAVEEIGAAAAGLGFDGIDLLVRSGSTLDPGSGKRIPAVVRTLGSYGLTVPMVTTDLTDPADYPAEEVLGGCADAGVGLVRLGYWAYEGARPVVEVVEQAERDLTRLVRLADRHGVRLAIQLHGGTIHASGALTRRLLDGRDPALLGAYPDPGNQAVQDGREDWRLTFDLLAPWLASVGVKNGGWRPDSTGPDGEQRWVSEWRGLADGMVPWRDILEFLVHTGFCGPLTLHSHYAMAYEQVLDQTRDDLAYVDRLLSRSG